MVASEYKKNELFHYKNIILLEIAAAKSYCSFHGAIGLALLSNVIVDFNALPECSDILQ